MCINIDDMVKDIAGIIAVIAFIKALYEYMRQQKDKRAKQFLDLRIYFRENKAFQNVIEHLYGDKDFSSVKNHVRIEFMAFFEDIAFLMNSGLIKKEVVFYMFGGDAIEAWENEGFWDPKLHTDKFWGLLNDFVKQMKDIRERYVYDSKVLTL